MTSLAQKYRFSFLTFVMLICMCCENGSLGQDKEEFVVSAFRDLDISLMSNPVKLSLAEYPLERLFVGLAGEMMSSDQQIASRTADGNELIEAVDLLVDFNKQEVLITLIGEIRTNGDDEDCGSKDGDGWKSYGTCTNEDCVKKTLEIAANDQGEPGVGKCLELRVRRALMNVRVCARTVHC